MTISDLIKQFEKEFRYSEYKDINRGGFGDCSCECELDGKAMMDWLRTHITEMVKGAVGEDEKLMRFEIEGAKGSVDVDGYRYRNKLRAEILNKLGIEK